MSNSWTKQVTICTYYVTLEEFVLDKYGEQMKQEMCRNYLHFMFYFDSILFGVIVFGMKGITVLKDFLKHFSF